MDEPQKELATLKIENSKLNTLINDLYKENRQLYKDIRKYESNRLRSQMKVV